MSHPSPPASSSSSAGFTLIEALVASAVFGVIMVGVFNVYATNRSAFNRGQSRAEAFQNGRVGLDRIVREVRVAGYDLSGTIDGLASPTPIQVGQADRLTFVADLDLDGTLDRVTFRVLSGRLLREFSSWTGAGFGAVASSVLADDVTALAVGYFDETDTQIAAPLAASDLADVRRVSVSLEVSASTVGQVALFPLVGDIRLRN